MAASKNLLSFADATFDADVLKSPVPVLVDFWAPWCGPCRAIAPVVEELADSFAGRLKVGKVNVDDNMKTAANYQITAIPTILIFKGGRVVEQIIGNVGKGKLQEAVTRHL
ncbi:MAG: thioredoxin [Deltaproteobacteria bacterium]|nr:thioredoxin [Deltaproteobacteria bacterium]